MIADWPFGDLKPFSFDFVMCDPPWTFELRSEKGEEKSPQAQYQTMSIDEIAALPVGHLAARDAILFLWGTWPLVMQGQGNNSAVGNASFSPIGKVIKAWGFQFSTGGAWIKRTKSGKRGFGTGYRTRSTCEPWFLCYAGNPETPGATRARNVIEGLAREHSRKPDAAYSWAEKYMPNARRVELFSRQTRKGWTTWGHEAGKFDAATGEDDGGRDDDVGGLGLAD